MFLEPHFVKRLQNKTEDVLALRQVIMNAAAGSHGPQVFPHTHYVENLGKERHGYQRGDEEQRILLVGRGFSRGLQRRLARQNEGALL